MSDHYYPPPLHKTLLHTNCLNCWLILDKIESLALCKVYWHQQEGYIGGVVNLFHSDSALFNSISFDILRFRAKTMPQTRGNRQRSHIGPYLRRIGLKLTIWNKNDWYKCKFFFILTVNSWQLLLLSFLTDFTFGA